MRFSEIADKKYVKDNKLGEENDSDIESDISDETEDLKEGWMTLKILEASEVNGVRFPEGVKIDVHADDAKKLLESKKAELISAHIIFNFPFIVTRLFIWIAVGRKLFEFFTQVYSRK